MESVVMQGMDKGCPFISIIIVNYNYAHLLPRTLNAILRQSFKDYEIVIVNNGSTDNSEVVIKEFCQNNPEVRCTVITIGKNTGPTPGYNAGLLAATGTYIMFNDADDWMEDDCLETLAGKARETDADRISGLYRKVDTEDNDLGTILFGEETSYWLILQLQCTLFRRSIFIEHNITAPLDIMLSTDIYLHTRFLQHAKEHAFCNDILYNYYVNTNSTSGTKSVNDILEMAKVSFDRIFMPVYYEIQDTGVREEIEYALVKYNYFWLLNYNRYSSYSKLLANYIGAREIIKGYLPNYLKCGRITLFRENGDRKTGRILTWILSRIEKLHLMKAALWFYWVLCKCGITGHILKAV